MVMEDYPRNLQEFNARFSSDEDCREYLCQMRWPEGFRCPRCGCGESAPVRTTLLRCHECRHQVSVTAGTIFQDTHIPLRLWFQAMWWMSTQKNGASALGLQRILGLKRYETAWTMLHRLRRAMVRPGRDLLSGRVEVDECYVGGPEEDLPGRLNLDKTLVVVAVQQDGPGIGRIRMRQISDASSASLVPFIEDSVSPGSVVHTDGWLGYSPLKGKSFSHQVTYLKGKREAPLGVVAAGSPGDLSAEAMANGNASGCGQPQASGLLSGRVHVSIQPAQVAQPRKAVLSPRSASRRRRSGDPPPNRSSGR